MTLLLLLALFPLDVSVPAPAPPKPAPPRIKRHVDPPRRPFTVEPARPLSIDLRASVGPVRDGGLVSIEVEHRFFGPTPERFLEGDRGVCAGPQDYLLIDGAVRALVEQPVCDGPIAPVAQEIAPGGSWISRGRIVLALGHHRLQAVYRVDQAHAALIERPDNMIVFRGEARSPEMVVDIPPRSPRR